MIFVLEQETVEKLKLVEACTGPRGDQQTAAPHRLAALLSLIHVVLDSFDWLVEVIFNQSGVN